MKFGKKIQADQVPGWSQFYLDYKSLKKIISALGANKPVSEATAIAVAQPLGAEILGLPFLSSGTGQEDERGREFQAYKAAFFFKLERELEKINAFYLEKEAELKSRLETLLSKRRAAASRVLPDSLDDYPTRNHVEWSAVEEGFNLLERDLGKLQQFVEINATGFRKILKKWDKRSKSSTKELYLARQVDVQPVFNRQLISELADTVAACLLDLTDLSVGVIYEAPASEEALFGHHLSESFGQQGLFTDLESSIRKAVADSDKDALREVIRYSESLSQSPEGRTHVTRFLWKAIIDAPADLADFILASTSTPFDYRFIDDINGRTCLHEAARVGALRLVDLCLQNRVQREKVDVYGRSALHYAAMSGHSAVCRRLLEEGLSADALDLDNCTPMIYATLRGSVECVRVLLEVGHVSVQATVLNGDLIPLSLAARSGHYDVVVLLLQHGAPSLPNTNGEYPTHLAAQEGHHTICQLLVGQEGWDTPDKYNEWTPLFHAARYGHEQCLRVLLEAGSRPDRTDELENSAVHYAAWYGHHTCVSLLMEAKQRYTAAHTPISHPSPMSMSDTCSTGGESDIDAIPSLSLPPPMMPYRVYGHNYLDKNTLVQVSIGHRMSRYPESSAEPSNAVRLRPPLSGLEKTERYLHTSPRLKLVVTASPAVTAAPFSISLPLADDERTVYTFQVPSIDTLSLEFSLYPNFGTKIVGRAASLPSSLGPGSTKASTLPIFDHRLHVIGEVSFEIITVTPFSGVTLEIGGAVETYWKAIASPLSTPSAKATTPRFMPPSRSLASAQTSPSAHSIISSGSHSLTHSSLSGSFFYITVQVTRDLQPVAYPEWRLPDDTFDLGVADVTLAQFLALAERRGRRPLPPASSSLSIKDIQAVISRSMVALSDLLKIIPAHLGVCLELAYPTAPVLEQRTLGHRVDLNDAVDAVLRTIYDITSLEGHVGRRNVVFTSFAPDVCAALNWKQPNYPVFFASQCGRTGAHAPSATALAVRDARDYRVSSLNSAVEVCKTNNLLGLLLDAEFLNEVPSLIQAVKDCGLLLGAFGVASQLPMLESNGIDAFLHDGVMTYSTRHY